MKKNNILFLILIYYLFFSILIVLNDTLIFKLINNENERLYALAFKNIIFILLNCFILILLIKHYLKNREVMEAKYKEKAIQLQTLLNSMPDFVSFKDADGRWVEANTFALKLFELNRNSAIGKTDLELARESEFFHDAFLHCAKTDQAAWDSKVPSTTVELIPQPDGKERVFESTKVPLFHSDGKRKGLLCIGRDITERKQVEDELKMTKELLEAFFENTTDAIIICDANDNYLKVNSSFEKIFGWKKEEINGRNPILVPNHLLNKASLLKKKLYTEGDSVSGLEVQAIHKDGYCIDVSLSYSPIRSKVGQIIGHSIIVRDITDRKSTEEFILKAEKLNVLGELAAGVAHEIRNPLTSLIGFTKLFDKNDMDPTNKKYLRIMSDELKRIDFIVNEFMLLAKPQVSNFAKTDTKQIVLDTVTLLESHANLINIKLITDFEGDYPPIYCEINKIKQVLINTIKNAMEAMKDGGEIIIQLNKKDSEFIEISVIDHGEGIPQEKLTKLGEPFYTTKEKGTGLGLMVCYKIIQEHHGTIEIDSIHQQGTTVKITLPIHPINKQG